MLKVFSVPILKDNYVHVIVDMARRHCIVIDPGVAAPVIAFLQEHKLKPQAILLTHHHGDHIHGVEELRDFFTPVGGPIVYAPAREKADIRFADKYLLPEDHLTIFDSEFRVMGLPGHTHGHVAYYAGQEGWLFSGDVLFSLGCGRIFDGTLVDQYQSLQEIKALPASTLVYCTHEYTWMNAQFCLAHTNTESSPDKLALQKFAEKVQHLRAQGIPTVPFTLQQELELNPFLRAKNLAQFQLLREARNHF